VSISESTPVILPLTHCMPLASATGRERAVRLTTVLIGDAERPEFRAALAALRELTLLIAVPSVEAALGHLTAGGVTPDFLVIAQSRPGEFSGEQIERLRRRAPLARVVGLLGSWCEGETRTGKPWPAAIRVYWYHWPPQCSRNVGRLLDGVCPDWGLPVTANNEDRLLFQAVEKPSRRRGQIVIAAPHRETFEALSTACRSRGHTTRWLRGDMPIHGERAVAALWVGGDLNEREAAQLRRAAEQLSGVPVVALLDFPRVSTCDRARRCGAAAVLARPFQLEDLFWHLDRAQGLSQDRSRRDNGAAA
jgi:hypothetical protein